jgi:diketogulonate reductase-like aldo/keto reductase
LVPLNHKTDGTLDKPFLASLEQKYKQSAANILKSWALHQVDLVVTTSQKEERIDEMSQLEGFVLEDQDLATISEKGRITPFVVPWKKKKRTSPISIKDEI